MLHKEVLTKFQTIFNIGEINTWWQNGYNSIRIRFDNGKQVVFTYVHDTKWCLETIESFIERMNKH